MHSIKKRHGQNYAQYLTEHNSRTQIDLLHVVRQMCEDAAVIANNRVFGIGPTRSPKFINEYRTILNEIGRADATSNDPDIIYTKEVVDRELKPIMGDNFKPWDIRYM